ncbi:MAG: hypothetical protein IT370_17305 [Deltaproteobacteria bacterium]|nr:hypothetical protein [Deltaproteobacteria bacterium]
MSTLVFIALALVLAAGVLHGWIVRRGWVRLAMASATLRVVRGGQDGDGVIALAGARALLRQRVPSEADAGLVEARLARQRSPRGAGLAAHGLLLAARGDREGARVLLASVATLAPAVCPAAALRLSREWLIGDAAERGDWAALAAMATSMATSMSSEDVSARAALLLLLGQRLTGAEGAPDDATLARAQRRAYGLRRTPAALVVLLTRARLVEPGSAPASVSGDLPEPAAAPVPADDLVGEATHRHVTLLACKGAAPRLVGDAVRRAGRAWDVAREDGRLEATLESRGAQLGALPGAGSSAARTLVEQIAADIAEIAASGLDIEVPGELGPTARRGLHLLRERTLSEVEQAARALHRRAEARRPLAPLDEWREWLALERAYLGAMARVGGGAAGDEVRRVLWPEVASAGSSLACWLWNDRSLRAFAQAIFASLARQATLVHDERLAAIHAKNAALSPM